MFCSIFFNVATPQGGSFTINLNISQQFMQFFDVPTYGQLSFSLFIGEASRHAVLMIQFSSVYAVLKWELHSGVAKNQSRGVQIDKQVPKNQFFLANQKLNAASTNHPLLGGWGWGCKWPIAPHWLCYCSYIAVTIYYHMYLQQYCFVLLSSHSLTISNSNLQDKQIQSTVISFIKGYFENVMFEPLIFEIRLNLITH